MNSTNLLLPVKRYLVIFFLAGIAPTIQADHKGKFDISFGGRVKLDGIYNTDSVSQNGTSKADLAFTPRAIPLLNTDNATNLNLRESRFWSTLRLPVAGTSLASYVEFDMFDTRLKANGTRVVANHPRLRHLYASIGGWTFGKTFTNFVNISAFPEINDANGPVGVHAIRQELLAYRRSLAQFQLSLSLENAESLLVTSTGRRVQQDDEHIPDLVGKLSMNKSWGELSVAAMTRQIRSSNINAGINNDKRWGAAVSVAGRIYLQGKDNMRFTISGGNAIGRYVSYGLFDDAGIAADGHLDLNEIISGHLAYQHWWSDRLRTSMVVGVGYADVNTNLTGTNVNKYVGSTSVNLIWSPTLRSTIGVEWLHGYRQQYNHLDGHMDRIQLSFIYRVD